ncbi:hypothetical protein [Nitratireductor sp. OM-1]|uniref:hypothetical protein n=1 Tax=Nitratireductor sp. OM-1 TaxID=1756988 RepID=UPI000DE06024|nr:hypothetical protein [Nitratireductor sp. OM-1]
MSLLWMDGFDTYGAHHGALTDNEDQEKVLASSGYTAVSQATFHDATRTGRGLAVRLSRGAAVYQTGRLRRAFETRDEVIMGAAVRVGSSDFDRFFTIMYDNQLGDLHSQISIARNAQGGISVVGYTTGPSGSVSTHLVAASRPNVMFPDVWHYVEVKYKPGSHVVVRLDGAVVLNGSGWTNPKAPKRVNLCTFICSPADWSTAHSNTHTYFDDLYLCDTHGTQFNTFCGDVVVHGLMPLQDAGPNDMSAYGGGLANYTAVDDVPPDDNLSYIYSNTLGHVDMFDLDDLPANIIDVLAVSVHARCRKDAAGTSNIKLKARYDGLTADSPPMTLPTVFVGKHHIFETAPDGGGWNKVKANNLNIGVEIA